MKTYWLLFIIILFTNLSMECSIVKAQSCPLTNIQTPDWTYSLDVNGLDDIAWDIEPIDDNSDGIKDDGFVVVGTAYKNSTLFRQALLVRLDASGHEVWKQTYGGNGNDNGYAVEQTSDGDIIVCGTKYSTLGSGSLYTTNVWIFKVDLTTGSKIGGSEHVYGGAGTEDGFDIKEDVTNG